MRGTSLLVALACLFLFSTTESSLAIPAEQILAEVNKLPPAERQKTLEEGARKEGVIKFASNESVEGIKILHGAFAARYPFIKVESWRAPGLRGVTRIVLEHRTGKLDTDVIGIPFEGVLQTEKEGVWARYNVAGADTLRRRRQGQSGLLDFFSLEHSCDGIQQQNGEA